MTVSLSLRRAKHGIAASLNLRSSQSIQAIGSGFGGIRIRMRCAGTHILSRIIASLMRHMVMP